ncbi:hypothetical protein SH528x_005242 [Novipirellula sp. SH528]|uniref:hypothetical protein n=1 Tax=Novipirellula sp. SH528 TaxID=3454466 RepID=UPI003FA10AC9
MADNLTDEQIDTIRAELHAGRKLNAVKLYKQWTGSSLVSAKNYVESLPAGPATDSWDKDLDGKQIDEILDAIQEGSKLKAVKLYKESTGVRLKESKEFIERLMNELGIEQRKGCAATIVLFVIAGIVTLPFLLDS